jgi:hypothetical protein
MLFSSAGSVAPGAGGDALAATAPRAPSSLPPFPDHPKKRQLTAEMLRHRKNICILYLCELCASAVDIMLKDPRVPQAIMN